MCQHKGILGLSLQQLVLVRFQLIKNAKIFPEQLDRLHKLILAGELWYLNRISGLYDNSRRVDLLID
jgi:hypothetical protein